MQHDILPVFIELVVLYIMYKTKNIYKFTFYMKLMIASCSMSTFLPIVIIFRQIIISKFDIYMYTCLTCSNMLFYMFVLLNMFSIFKFSYHVLFTNTSCYISFIYIFLSRICNFLICLYLIPFVIQFIYILYNL